MASKIETAENVIRVILAERQYLPADEQQELLRVYHTTSTIVSLWARGLVAPTPDALPWLRDLQQVIRARGRYLRVAFFCK